MALHATLSLPVAHLFLLLPPPPRRFERRRKVTRVREG
jgi:hypothetical protein